MRIRTVKPSFWKSETLAQVAKEYRLLAVALLNYADDEGYFMANEALIRGECFPFDENSKSIRGGLQELSRIGYIALGTSSDGQRLGRIPNFLEHQRIDKASPSKIKEKTIAWDDSSSPPRTLQESSPPEVEVGNGSRKRNGRSLATPLPDNFKLSDRVLSWGAAKGYSTEALTQHYENFILQATAKGYTYANWDSALIKAISSDWAKVGKGGGGRSLAL